MVLFCNHAVTERVDADYQPDYTAVHWAANPVDYFVQHMRANNRRADVLMPQECLNRADVIA